MRIKFAKVESVVLPLAAIVAVTGLWHLLVVWTATRVFPSPAAVALAIVELGHRGLLLRYTVASLLRVAGGYSIAIVLGIPIGILLGWFPPLARAFNPVVQVLRPISPIAWIPVSIILFGVGNGATVFLIFLGAFFPVVVTTMNGAQRVPVHFLRAGRNFGLSRGALFRRVVFPAMLPEILTGLRIALGIAWLVVVAAEMVAINSGLGYLIIDSRNAGKRYDLVVAGMLLIGTVGLLLDIALRQVETLRSVRWGFRRQ